MTRRELIAKSVGAASVMAVGKTAGLDAAFVHGGDVLVTQQRLNEIYETLSRDSFPLQECKRYDFIDGEYVERKPTARPAKP